MKLQNLKNPSIVLEELVNYLLTMTIGIVVIEILSKKK